MVITGTEREFANLTSFCVVRTLIIGKYDGNYLYGMEGSIHAVKFIYDFAKLFLNVADAV